MQDLLSDVRVGLPSLVWGIRRGDAFCVRVTSGRGDAVATNFLGVHEGDFSEVVFVPPGSEEAPFSITVWKCGGWTPSLVTHREG